MHEETATLPPIEIPPDSLSQEILNAVIDEFILREGTDYGAVEISVDKKRAQILRQIQSNSVVIAFDPSTESVTLLTRLEFTSRSR